MNTPVLYTDLRSEMAVSGVAAVGPEVRLDDVDEQCNEGQDHRGDRDHVTGRRLVDHRGGSDRLTHRGRCTSSR